MRACVLQHVPFEGPGTIQPFLADRRIDATTVHLYRGDALPAPADFDLLVVMGGPMSVHDEREHRWLIDEKRLIEAALQADRRILGICLGAQLIADVLGSTVEPMGYREIGWFPVDLASTAPAWIARALGERFTPLHWHGDTFTLPVGAVQIGSSAACAQQGFVYGDRIVGLQFHLEFTPDSVHRLIANAADELDDSRWVQTPEQLLDSGDRFAAAHRKLDDLLDRLADNGS